MGEESWLLRRAALPAVGVVAILLVVLRFTLWNNGDSTAIIIAAILDNTIAAVSGAIAVSLYLIFIRIQRGRSEAFFIRGKELKSLIASDAAKSHTWRLRARTGSYFVRETLPLLASNAVVDMVLMDPSHADDLRAYQALRPAAERAEWEPVRIQADIVVSIIRAIQFKAANPLLTINLHTTRSMWSQSLDISDDHSFLCGQGRRDLAVVVPESDEIYERFANDFAVLKTLAVSRPIPQMDALGSRTEPINSELIAALRSTFVDWFALDITEKQLHEKIVERSAKGHHYG
jgi:hypothetical protein